MSPVSPAPPPWRGKEGRAGQVWLPRSPGLPALLRGAWRVSARSELPEGDTSLQKRELALRGGYFNSVCKRNAYVSLVSGGLS